MESRTTSFCQCCFRYQHLTKRRASICASQCRFFLRSVTSWKSCRNSHWVPLPTGDHVPSGGLPCFTGAGTPAFGAGLSCFRLQMGKPSAKTVKKGRRMSRGLWLLCHIVQCRDNFSGVAEFVNGPALSITGGIFYLERSPAYRADDCR